MKLLKTAIYGSTALLLSLPLVAQTETAPDDVTKAPTWEDATESQAGETEAETSEIAPKGAAASTAEGIEKVSDHVATVEFDGQTTELEAGQKTALQEFAKSQVRNGQPAKAYVLAAAPTSETPTTPATPGVNSTTTVTPTGPTNGQKMLDDRVDAVRSALSGMANLTVEVIDEEQIGSATDRMSPTSTDNSVTGSTAEGTSTGTAATGDTSTGGMATDTTSTQDTETTGTSAGGSVTESAATSPMTADADDALKNQMASYAEEGIIVVGISTAAEGMSH